mgnify:FL=1
MPAHEAVVVGHKIINEGMTIAVVSPTGTVSENVCVVLGVDHRTQVAFPFSDCYLYIKDCI